MNRQIIGLFKRIAERVADDPQVATSMLPVLEFIARSYPPAWLLLAEFAEEVPSLTNTSIAEYLRRYLEAEPDGVDSARAWIRLNAIYRASGDVVGACAAFITACEKSNPPMSTVSEFANWLNNQNTAIANMDNIDRNSIFGSLSSLMERQIKTANATDLSRLSWLHLHRGDVIRAKGVAGLGLEKDPLNPHCQKLMERLSDQ